MPKLLSKIAGSSVVIAALVAGGFYWASLQNENPVSNNAAASDNHQSTLVSVWDKKTELEYAGTLEKYSMNINLTKYT